MLYPNPNPNPNLNPNPNPHPNQVCRISEGQPIAKRFSERALLRSLVAQLERLPEDVGRVVAVLDLTEASLDGSR